MDRRSFLKGAGVVTVAVVGGVVFRAYDQGVFSVGEGPAYEPWKHWRTDSQSGPLALVRAAILAASPHNTQPWLFKITNSSIELYLDPKRNVGALDPYLREEHIGMGCALQNLLLAAGANGYQATVTTFPGKLGPIPADPAPKLLARVDLLSGKPELSELYDAIPHRHTNRSLYNSGKSLSPEFVDALGRLTSDSDYPDAKLFLFTAEADRRKLAAIISASNDVIYADPEVDRGSGRWIRSRWSEVQKFRDGLSIDAFGQPPLATAAYKIMPLWLDRWIVSRGPKDGYSQLMLSAALMGIITVRDRYDQENCLRAGQIWQCAHLLATARGVAGRPCNEAVEMIDYERVHERPALRTAQLGELIGEAAWQPTFVFYMGYPTLTARASPRRPVQSVVL
ncbi:MAG: twin-arginine translocation signal domain-containing protein [Candidatus Sulfotelmatobacter sp.]